MSKKKYDYKRAIILGGSKGIGKQIHSCLKDLNIQELVKCSRKDIDTSNINSVKNFIKKYSKCDILVLNTGGPPNIEFNLISEELWYKYFNQLFLGYSILLKDLKINKNGYIFHISSAKTKEPNQNLIISTSLRSAFTNLLKSLSYSFNKNKVSTITIAPGPFKTNRIKSLVKDINKFEKDLPLGVIGNPKEIGLFVKFIIENKIKYITGSTIYFDGSILKSNN